MQGMYFVEVIDGKIATQGLIQDLVGPGYYRIQFAANPPFSRVVAAERMQAMFLFSTHEEMEAWVTAAKKGMDQNASEEKPAKRPARRSSVKTKNQKGGVTAAKVTKVVE